MSEIYNEAYYHSGCGPVPYEEPEHWVKFFGGIADRIVSDLHPETVLDAGCAMGYLVAALRDRGVKAYGIDISQYAVSMAREDIRPYCFVGSLTEKLPAELPEKYDLVVTIEVLEHLYAEDGERAIQHLCQLSDTILFSSTPDDFSERTHVNVQQREYWAKLFFKNGFMDDINYRPKYLTAYASLFRRGADLTRQIEDYERNIRLTERSVEVENQKWNQAVQDKEVHIRNLEAMRAEENRIWSEREKSLQEQLKNDKEDFLKREEQLQSELRQQAECIRQKDAKAQEQRETNQKLQKELSHYKEHYLAAIGQREELTRQLAAVQRDYQEISTAFFWKVTKPLRVIVNAIERPFRGMVFVQLVRKGFGCLHEHGWGYTWKKVMDWRKNRQDYVSVGNKPLFTEEELEKQRQEHFPKQVKFSIVVPLFNTPEKFLREMIQSVLDQTYADWELCMADGSDSEHRDVEKICRQYIKHDHRIKYQKLEKNLGISGNTNACLEMAEGDYIGLFDHDDLLHPAALHEVMCAICEQDADFIYTDEMTFSDKVTNVITAHFKPDFAPDNLRANNYICHFTVFKVDILKKIDGFRSEYDGSQDHDFILRATEQAKKIVHIPKLLYFWRSHPNSVASDINSKTYAIDAGKRAVHDHIRRMGMEAVVESSRAFPTIYRIKYELKETPKVSIIIPNKNHYEDLRHCVESIQELTTYPDYEIIIVDNQSDEKEIIEYYDQLMRTECVRVIYFDKQFNYSDANNFGVKYATGEYYILLNNDTKVISPSWIEEMLMYAQRDDVGAVGAKLYFPDHTVQHAGIILGLGPHRTAGHAFSKVDGENLGYMGRLYYAQNVSAVTAACVMIPRHVWEEVNGLDASFAVAFNDVDLCMRIRKAGYLIVWTPYAELYHYESKSRGSEDTPEKKKRFEEEVRRFQERWKNELSVGDPYYNPNLTLERADFSIKRKGE